MTRSAMRPLEMLAVVVAALLMWGLLFAYASSPAQAATLTVKAGDKARNTLGGTSGADLLLGQAGNDMLGGAGGNDVLCGANGNDKLSGGTGSDTFDGGPGTDVATDYNAAAGDSRTNIP